VVSNTPIRQVNKNYEIEYRAALTPDPARSANAAAVDSRRRLPTFIFTRSSSPPPRGSRSGEASFHECVGSFRPGGYQQATDRVATVPLAMNHVAAQRGCAAAQAAVGHRLRRQSFFFRMDVLLQYPPNVLQLRLGANAS